MQTQPSADSLRIFVPLLSGVLGSLVTLIGNHFYTRWRERKAKREHIFRTLMSTRGFKFNQVHVEALCSVEVEWSGAKDAEVRSAWKAYNYHLNKMVPDDINDPANIDWRNTVDELFANLIVELSKSVGKPVDKTDVKAGSYGPKLWWEIQQETNLLRKGLLSIIGSGRGVSIPVSVQYDAAVMNAIEKAGNAAQASNTTPQLKS